jgi:hypothetical protein
LKRGSYLAAQYRRLVKRRGDKKAFVGYGYTPLFVEGSEGDHADVAGLRPEEALLPAVRPQLDGVGNAGHVRQQPSSSHRGHCPYRLGPTPFSSVSRGVA